MICRRLCRRNRNNGYVVFFIAAAVVVSIIAGMSSSFEIRSINRNKYRSLPRHWRTTTTNSPFVFVMHFAIPPTKSLVDISTNTSSSSSDGESIARGEDKDEDADDDVNYNDTNIPFFASTACTTSSVISAIDDETNQNQTTTSTIMREEQDRMLTRRDAIKYSAVLTISSLITGAAYTKTNHLAKETPSPPKRPSFIPEPVLKPINVKELAQSKRSEANTETKKAPSSSSSSSSNLSQSKNPATTKSTKPKITTAQPKTKTATQPKTATTTTIQPKKTIESATTTSTKPKPKTTTKAILNTGQIEPVNLTQIVSETNINVTINCNKECLSIDSKNFTFNKVTKPKVPKWLPSFLTPSPQVVKTMSNNELLVAATVAGSVTEMGRTLLLYPLQTIKTRVQADQNNDDNDNDDYDDGDGDDNDNDNDNDNEYEDVIASLPFPIPSLSNQITTLGVNIQQKINEGDLYAGISPTLLVSVPATGIYYGVRDVTKRILYMMPAISETWISVLAAVVADVVSLCFRTPSETLAIRLQNNNETLGDWFGDSYARLPMVIATDLPYLLSKIVLNRMLIQGTISVSDYAEYAVLAAVVAGFLSTPFDVARTRILLDKQLVLWDDDDDDEVDDVVDVDQPTTPVIANTRPGFSVLQTMIQIMKEGDGGIKNLYAGWLERVLYLGIGRAWLEPVQLIGYIGIRDTILLEWF
jgi:hypothetical protein